MRNIRFLWIWTLIAVTNVAHADEIYQKVLSPAEVNETDTYIICNETMTAAIYKAYEKFRGMTTIMKQDQQGDWLLIDPDRTSARGVVPDEFRMVKVKKDVYCIQFVSSGDCLYYDRSSNYLQVKALDVSDWKTQWTFKQNGTGVYVACYNRTNYFISPYSNKFGVYTNNNNHIKTFLYKKMATRAKRVVVGGAGFMSFSTPEKIPVAASDALRAYVVSQTTREQVQLTEIGDIPPNTAVILHGSPGTYFLNYTDRAVPPLNRNLLRQSDGTVRGDGSTIYSLGTLDGETGFYVVASGVVIPAGKAYLRITESVSAKCLPLFLWEDPAIATQIGVPRQTVEGCRYDLSGRVVRGLRSGIVIMNGRKYRIAP